VGYRAEIDGLRAIAVIPVILFHAGFDIFSGGFVGVDVFFVISGYLITGIILSEKERDEFSLVNFYERRARRILPALFFVMLVSLPFAWLWMLPSDLRSFSQSLVAVSTFSSNFLFWLQTGYWGTANELKPLLHTWSLAVEEQYYVLFPLFLMLMWGFRKRWILVSFMLIAVISLALAQWGAFNAPSANFFLLPTRAWELAIGASIAFYFVYKETTVRALLSRKSVNETLAFAGLVMIGYAVIRFNESVPFPGFYALIPTIGAALVVIFASQKTFVGRLLGSKLFVSIGLISYSAYLWHQPLLAFVRQASLSEPSKATLAVMAFASFPLAYVSWRFVEQPFRRKDGISKYRVFLYSMIGSIAFIVIGVVGTMQDGFTGRSTASKISFGDIEAKIAISRGLGQDCQKRSPSSACRTSNRPEILVWGDSYAMQLVAGILASEPDAKIIQMTKNTCGPFFDMAHDERGYPAKSCLEFNGQVRKWLRANKTIKYAVLSSPFHQYISGENKLVLRNGEVRHPTIDLIDFEFKKTLSELESMGISPIVFSPPPSNGTDIGRCLVRAMYFGKALNLCNYRVDEMSRVRRETFAWLERVREGFPVVFLNEFLCDEKVCRTHFGSTFLYRDAGHLSTEGSAALGKALDFYDLIACQGQTEHRRTVSH